MMFAPAEEAPEFPGPPAYFGLFATASSSDGTSPAPFPIEPPPVPAPGEEINIFGFQLELEEKYTRIVPPEQQMYAAGEETDGPVTVQVVDYQAELRRLNQEVLWKFLDLLECLKTDPVADRHQALQELGVRIDNIYDLLSGYRQHQALVQMVDRLKVQLEEKRKAIADLTSGITEAKERLKAANATFLSSFKEHVEGPKDADAATAMDTS